MIEPCPHCGADRPDRVERFGLAVQRDPYAVYWRGVRHHRPRGEVETLYHLVRRGRASHLSLAMLTVSEEAETNVAKVRICRLRHWLRRLGGEIEIRNERGWGYVLERAPPA
ncbi:hypothetical protein [Sphingomonas sp. GM_Shp_1]|uniref:hypothetical protein n=1 Tax=Sphingomonas sp. GM_Shp_1 TaxID=2937381 RepID=UPI00226B7700|nr:hypothetical protein [Sphingomonas sp. GM_Shp_1]